MPGVVLVECETKRVRLCERRAGEHQSDSVGLREPSIQTRMAALCTHLFIDEAQHAEAPTWNTFRERFGGKLVLQFTATPFREDSQAVDGKLVYVYPLRKAQPELLRNEFTRAYERERAERAQPSARIAGRTSTFARSSIPAAPADQHSMMLTAKPPREVSLYFVSMSAPVSRMVLMTWSRLT